MVKWITTNIQWNKDQTDANKKGWIANSYSPVWQQWAGVIGSNYQGNKLNCSELWYDFESKLDI